MIFDIIILTGEDNGKSLLCRGFLHVRISKYK